MFLIRRLVRTSLQRRQQEPQGAGIPFLGESNTPWALNYFSSDGVRGEGRRKVNLNKASKVTWGWLSVEWCLLTKHPRKLPKLIKTGLCENIHRMRLFVLPKAAPFQLGFSGQSLNPTGANLYYLRMVCAPYMIHSRLLCFQGKFNLCVPIQKGS